MTEKNALADINNSMTPAQEIIKSLSFLDEIVANAEKDGVELNDHNITFGEITIDLLKLKTTLEKLVKLLFSERTEVNVSKMIILDLCSAMNQWGSQEDGIPGDLGNGIDPWSAFVQAEKHLYPDMNEFTCKNGCGHTVKPVKEPPECGNCGTKLTLVEKENPIE